MFGCLRHYPLIQRHCQQHQINAADSGQHVFDKPFMSRYIDDSNVLPFLPGQTGKSKLNCDASLLFLFQPVCIRACQCLNQTGFTMIHMTRRTDYYIMHPATSPDSVSKMPPGSI